ncbi:MAG: hypothetical protein ACM3MI_03510 [Clostridiales bacterium]
MKKILFLLLVLSTVSFSQFRDQAETKSSLHDGMISNNTPSVILGFFNPDNFRMQHSYSLSYSAFGGNGLAMGVYTNSMIYKFNDKLNIQVDASLVHTPYSTFNRSIQDQINGLYLSKAELNYRPSDNFMINVQYSHNPMGYYSPYGYLGDWGMFNQNSLDRNIKTNAWLYGK